MKCIILLLFSYSYFSFSEDEIDLFLLDLADLAKIKIAAKQEQTVYSSPSSVSVITREQIKQMGITSLQALLNFVPGFQSTRDIEQGTTNRISVRGRSTALSESVLIQIDGKKINDLYTGGISILNRLLTLGFVKQIEIIRGPGSALYGSNAFLGVINIVTETAHNEVNIAADSIGGVSSNILLSKSFDNEYQLDTYFSLFKQEGDDYFLTDLNGISSQVKDPIQGVDFYMKYQLENLFFTARYMQRQLDDFITFGSVGNDINNENTKQWSVAAEYENQIVEDLHYHMLVSHSEDEWDSFALFIPKDVEIEAGFSLDENYVGGPYLTSKTSKMEIDLTYPLGNNNLFSFGSAFEKAEITNADNATSHNLFTLESLGEIVKLTGDESFNSLNTRTITSFYLQDQIKLNQALELTAGVRFDKYNDFGSSTNPRLALVWSPSDGNSLKFMYGTAFRAPNFLELYDQKNWVDFGNVDLNAEEVTTTEIAWLTTFFNWHIEITAFDNQFEQLIVLGEPVKHPENPFFAPRFTNTENQKSQGVETQLQFKASQNFAIKFLWNWFSEDSNINTARNSGAVIFDYQWLDTYINFASYYRGNNDFIENQNNYFVSYANLSHRYSTNLRLNIAISNLFDEKYKTQSIVYSQGIDNRGRVITFNVEYTF
jgi:outer membrane receptor for ferrienterochelin and colicin